MDRKKMCFVKIRASNNSLVETKKKEVEDQTGSIIINTNLAQKEDLSLQFEDKGFETM